MFDPHLPLEKAHTAPSVWYRDPQTHARELDQVFGRGWQYAGLASQVAEAGDYLTVQVGREPVLVARNQKGILSAFSNVCRHKAAKIMTAPHGKAACFQCQYHGWTYDLSGNLRSTPQFEGVENFCKDENRLPLFAVETVGPFVFVSAQNPPRPFEEDFAPFLAQVRTLGLEKLAFARRVEYELGCNWKVFVDNYLDGGYHVNTLHPALAGVLDDAAYKTEVFARSSLQSSPLVARDDSAGAVRKGGSAFYWWLYPNFMANIYEGVMDTNYVLPLGPDRCKVIFDYFFSPGTDRAFIEQSIQVAHQVQMEDQEISERVQVGLQSATYASGRFSVKREAAAYQFHRLLAEDLHV